MPVELIVTSSLLKRGGKPPSSVLWSHQRAAHREGGPGDAVTY